MAFFFKPVASNSTHPTHHAQSHTHTRAHTFTYTHSCKYLNPTNNFICIITLPINISLSSAAFHFTIIVRNAQCFHMLFILFLLPVLRTSCAFFFLTLLYTLYNSLLPQYIRLDFFFHISNGSSTCCPT